MAHLSPSAIFSPTVARQQLAAAKDWSYVDSWLSQKFNGKPAPPYERNADTLKILLALAAANESADEDRELLCKVEAKTLNDLQAQQASEPYADILHDIEDGLTLEGHASLDALATASVTLNQPRGDAELLAKKILDLQIATFDLEQASDRVNILHEHLQDELVKVNELLDELRRDSFQPTEELAKKIQEYQRKIKMLTAKLPELKDRAVALSASTKMPKPMIQDIRKEEDRYGEATAIVKDLEMSVKSYHGLPHDVDLARLELETLRVELNELTRQRDAMFEGLVERESPQKPRSRR